MSRIVNTKQYERILGLVSGREIRKGEDDSKNLHLAPRILPDADWSDPPLQDEIFGPILPVVSFETLAELKVKLQGYKDPLALYIFSRDQDFIAAVSGAIRSGGICINDTLKQGSNLKLPFGGIGTSGHGRYRGKRGLESFTYERAVTKRYFFKDVFESLPPRGKQVEFLKKWMK
jgi:aldehyde dehydrogenase (NAD+)